MPDTTRTFVAVAVPDALTPRLRRLQQGLAPDMPGAKWVEAPPFHVTLAFLGDVPHAELNDVCKAVGEVCAGFPPLELSLEAVGAFPDGARPRVIWTGVAGAGLDGLLRLQAAVAAAVARVGYPTDSRPFHPHVTLAHIKSGKGRGASPVPRDVTHFLDRRRTWTAGPFRVVEAVTFASTLNPDGPVYTALARAPLKFKGDAGAS